MQKMEIITRTERRRKFSDTFRRQVVAETEQPDVTIISVARKYELAQSLVFKWREKYLGRPRAIELNTDLIPPTDILSMSARNTFDDFTFAGQVSENGCVTPPDNQLPKERSNHSQKIEIMLPNGIALRVGDQFNEDALTKVMRILGERA